MAATGLLAATAAVGSGAAAVERTEPQLAFACYADLGRQLSVSWDGGGYRGYVRWEPERFVSSGAATVTYADGQLRLTVQGVYIPVTPGDPLRQGSMELTAEVTELARTLIHDGVGPGSGDANDQRVYLEIRRLLELVGPARVAFDNGHAYQESGCTGWVVVHKLDHLSDPAAAVGTGSFAGAWCDPTRTGSRVDQLVIDMFRDGEPWTLDLSTYDDSGTPDDPADDVYADYSSASEVTLTELAGGRPVELVGWGTQGEELRATITMRWTDLSTSRRGWYSGTWTRLFTLTSGPLLGTARFDDGTSVGLDCLAFRDAYRHLQAGGGSPVTGPTPVNDTPAGAVRLAGATVVQTGGTALEAEVSNPCIRPSPQVPDYRATHTVWFTVTGNGPTTIDTAGTRFDTALAVYTSDGSGRLTPVSGACSDDIRAELNPRVFGLSSLQATSTFQAEPGTAYYVQVGGVSSDDNDGALRISVR
jgi:hypothetical protein